MLILFYGVASSLSAVGEELMTEKGGFQSSKNQKKQRSLWGLARGYKIGNYRRFNNGATYFLPNDADETSRLYLQHFVMRQLVHGNFNAPVDDLLDQGIKVLDVGCGSGSWDLEMATEFPKSSFVGVDVASVFPTSNNLPPNCTFVKANALKKLPFQDGTFDYVFQRFMVFSYTREDWVVMVKELVRVTKPGGWLELFEHHIRLERPPPKIDIWDGVEKLTRSRGIDIDYVLQLKDLLVANNLTQIEEDYISCPLGWGSRTGELHGQNCVLVYQAMQPIIGSDMGLSKVEFDKQVVKLVNSYKEYKTWHKAPYVYGRKPL